MTTSTTRLRPLPRAQRAVLSAIKQLTAEQGFPPTLREIADELGLSSHAGIAEKVYALEKKGWLTRKGGAPRTLRVVPCSHPGEPLDVTKHGSSAGRQFRCAVCWESVEGEPEPTRLAERVAAAVNGGALGDDVTASVQLYPHGLARGAGK